MSNVSVAEFKAWKRVEVGTDDSAIQIAIDTAEEVINQHCGRQFVIASAATSRVFAPTNDRVSALEIDDCTTVTTVVDNGGAVAASAYQLEPLNGRNAAGDNVPYTTIRLIGGYWTTNNGAATVNITATWGWASLPDRYYQAVKILAADILDQRDIRNGVIGITDYAAMRVRENPVVSMLLGRLVRARTFGIG